MYQPFFKKYLEKIEGKNIFVIAGDNEYYRTHSQRYLLERFNQYPITEIEEATIEIIQSELSTFDLFSDVKIILIDNFAPISSKSSKKLTNDEISSLIDIISNTDNIVIFNQSNFDKRKKVTKELLKIAHFIECSNLTKKEFPKFLKYLNEKHQSNVPDNVLTDLSLYLDESNLLVIEKEFEKLSLFPDKITKDNIYDIISVNHQQKIFDLMDKVVQKNAREAIEVYEKLLFNKESEYVIFHFLSNQFSNMLKIKMIKEDNILIDIAKTLKIHPFMCDKLEKHSRKFSLNTLISYQQLFLETDYKIKGGINPSKDAVRHMILSMCV